MHPCVVFLPTNKPKKTLADRARDVVSVTVGTLWSLLLPPPAPPLKGRRR